MATPTAIGGADRPRPATQPVKAPLNYISKRMRKKDFTPVVGKTAAAPTPRFGSKED